VNDGENVDVIRPRRVKDDVRLKSKAPQSMAKRVGALADVWEVRQQAKGAD
jgi:hypothetical protein